MTKKKIFRLIRILFLVKGHIIIIPEVIITIDWLCYYILMLHHVIAQDFYLILSNYTAVEQGKYLLASSCFNHGDNHHHHFIRSEQPNHILFHRQLI